MSHPAYPYYRQKCTDEVRDKMSMCGGAKCPTREPEYPPEPKPSAPAGSSTPNPPALSQPKPPASKSHPRPAQAPTQAVTAVMAGAVIRFTLPIPAGTTALELMDLLRALPSTAVVG